MTDRTAFDREMMAVALAMARRGLGQTAPNPAVGAVIADEATGEIIARGVTQRGGRPHAETEAIRDAGDRTRGKTLYVTLEPCAHHGKTPPCADAIIRAGIARVVVGVGDPDPRTAGAGVARLRANGIAVTECVCEQEARRMTLGHIRRVTARRPCVEVKLATAADGSIARGGHGTPRWVTSEEARAQGHLMRARADAILVGAATIRDDNADLTCRLPGLADRSPHRVVISASLEIPLEANVVQSARRVPTTIMTTPVVAQSAKAQALTAAGVRITPVAATVTGLDLRDVLTRLADDGTTRLLVEGGPRVWQALDALDVIDAATLFQAGPAPGHASAGRPTGANVLSRYLPRTAMTLADARRVGPDDVLVFFRAGS